MERKRALLRLGTCVMWCGVYGMTSPAVCVVCVCCVCVRVRVRVCVRVCHCAVWLSVLCCVVVCCAVLLIYAVQVETMTPLVAARVVV